MNVRVDCTNVSSNSLPTYATPESAGCDVRAAIGIACTLRPNERSLIPTGLSVAIPSGYEIQVRPRSGFAYKQGVTVLNSPGTIDGDYRGEIGVLLHNTSKETVTIEPGDRIAQLVLAPVFQIDWNQVATLDDTLRGGHGFGSTGKN